MHAGGFAQRWEREALRVVSCAPPSPGLVFKAACLCTPPKGWVATRNPVPCELVTSLAMEADRSFKKCNFRIDILHAKPGAGMSILLGESSGAVTQKEEAALTLPFCTRAADKRIVQMNL